MVALKKVCEKKQYDVPTGIFLKLEYADWYYGVLADDVLLEVSETGITAKIGFSEYDNPLDMVQVSKTEFQKAFGKAFQSMQKYHSWIQAAPERKIVTGLNFKTIELV